MEKLTDATGHADAGWMVKSLGLVWEKIIIGDSRFNPEKSCYQLATEYLHSGNTPEQCARNFIKWQTTKAGLSGFALGLPGFAAMPLTIPADFASLAYLQLRMIAVIGILFGWNAQSDQLRTVAFSCLIGTTAGELTRDASIQASSRLGRNLVSKIPGESLKKLNKFLRVHNLFVKGIGSNTKVAAKATATTGAKAGSKGIVNLTKAVPLLGAAVGGGINIVFTRKMGLLAVRMLKEGPPDGGQVGAEQRAL